MGNVAFGANHKPFSLFPCHPYHPVTGSKINSTGETNRYMYKVIRFGNILHKQYSCLLIYILQGSTSKFIESPNYVSAHGRDREFSSIILHSSLCPCLIDLYSSPSTFSAIKGSEAVSNVERIMFFCRGHPVCPLTLWQWPSKLFHQFPLQPESKYTLLCSLEVCIKSKGLTLSNLYIYFPAQVTYWYWFLFVCKAILC